MHNAEVFLLSCFIVLLFVSVKCKSSESGKPLPCSSSPLPWFCAGPQTQHEPGDSASMNKSCSQ